MEAYLNAPKQGLNTLLHNKKLIDWGKKFLDLSKRGLEKRNELFKYKSCVGLKCFPIKIDGAYDIDLDYPEDWVTAEKKYNEIKNK